MESATINVRLPRELKQSGDKVLKREGISTSELIRDLYHYLDQKQELPELAAQSRADEQEALIQKRREALDSITGILDGELDLDAMRWERLQRQIQPGVRV